MSTRRPDQLDLLTANEVDPILDRTLIWDDSATNIKLKAVTGETLQQFAIAPHIGATDPHPQYATDIDLVSGLTGKENSGVAAGLISAHVAANDPHSQYALNTELVNAVGTKEDSGVAAGLISAHVAANDPHSQYATDTDLVSGLAGKQTLNSQLTEIGSQFSNAINGSNLRKRDDGTGLEFAIPRCRILYRWGGTEVITGTTTETNYVNGSFVIPANTLSANSTLDIYAVFSNNSSASNKVIRYRFGTNIFVAVTVTTNTSQFLLRQIFLTSLTSQISAGSGSLATGGGATSVQSLSFNFGQNQTFQISSQLVDVADNVSLRYFELREIR